MELESPMPCDLEKTGERMFVQVQHATEFCPHIWASVFPSGPRVRKQHQTIIE